MSVIEASSVGVKTMADGTLRLTVDIEPRHAQAAFVLFGAPGTPMALAALKTGQQFAEPEPAEKPLKEGPRRTTGPMCQWLVMRCKEPEFRNWASYRAGLKGDDERTVAEWCRGVCGVESRSEIDGNPSAEADFERYIRRPWLKKQGQTA